MIVNGSLCQEFNCKRKCGDADLINSPPPKEAARADSMPGRGAQRVSATVEVGVGASRIRPKSHITAGPAAHPAGIQSIYGNTDSVGPWAIILIYTFVRFC